ncbi:MAG TPA: SusD/RagB family nutrient-binding outer membrane lipoprotein [Gemmatimonadaceae bacterium]|nr:SusD/RagB family nutrient-binding outer membrane lipoprotein [Gemmatimonadaceae bacterium]
MTPRTSIRIAALALGVSLAGCNSFLHDEKTKSDPNVASNASPAQLFTAIQANLNIVMAGPAVRLTEMWVQRMSGTDRQYQSYGQYQGVTENSFDVIWTAIYDGGGLVDIRKVEDAARANNDRTYLGIARIYEALLMGTAADLWGDVPYSEVLSGAETPKLDLQADVYDHVQAVLDSAIADLAAGEGVGPTNTDFSFGGDATKWTAVAHTLKARFYLHTAKVNTGAYAQAATEAALGIQSPSGDWLMYSSAKAGEENIWFQFFRERDSYMRAGKFFVDLMTARADPRKAEYFGPAGNGQIGGANPGENLNGSTMSWLSATRGAPAFHQPIVTADENSLILAEAQARGGATGAAITTLNAERARHSLGNVSGALTGNALLMAILDEKFVATFQTYEGYADYRRTCYPNLTPAAGADQFAGNLPPRFPYPSVEQTANPNVPDLAAQPRRNTLDSPPLATSLDGAACKAEK